MVWLAGRSEKAARAMGPGESSQARTRVPEPLRAIFTVFPTAF